MPSVDWPLETSARHQTPRASPSPPCRGATFISDFELTSGSDRTTLFRSTRRTARVVTWRPGSRRCHHPPCRGVTGKPDISHTRPPETFRRVGRQARPLRPWIVPWRLACGTSRPERSPHLPVAPQPVPPTSPWGSSRIHRRPTCRWPPGHGTRRARAPRSNSACRLFGAILFPA